MDSFLHITKNYRSAQSKYAPDVFSKIIWDFDLIIEIGTFTGAFTDWLSQNSRPDCKIFSYDIREDYREIKKSPKVNFRISDCFDLKTMKEISDLISSNNRVLFLCDGGDKETEFKLYSRYLKNGDVIMIHDFEHNKEDYEKIKNEIGWPTNSESKYENLSRYLDELKLSPYYYEEFKRIMWGSFIKNI